MIDRQKEIEWRKEYLQEMRNTLNAAAEKYNIERIVELHDESDPGEDDDDAEDFTEDEHDLMVFLFQKMLPLSFVLYFDLKNNPFRDDPNNDKGNYPRYTAEEMYDFISEMTPYGKYRIANHFPGDDKAYQELLEAVFANDKKRFLETIDNHNIDVANFRRCIKGAMFICQNFNLIIQKVERQFTDPSAIEDGEKLSLEIKDAFEYIFEHYSKEEYDGVRETTALLYLDDDDEEEELDDEIDFDEDLLSRIVLFQHSDLDMLHSFFQWSNVLAYFAMGFEAIFTDAEISVVNDFLDDPRTNHILGLMERHQYIIMDKGFNPKRFFIPQPIRDEIKNGTLDELLSEIQEKHFFDVPDNQEQPETLQPVDQKPEGDGKPNDTEYVPHWPTDEELKGYDDIDEDSRFFTNTIFGSPGNVKASDVDKLLNVLIPLNIIKDELETKLTFLARYSGKSIPHLELKRIEWKMLDSTNRERALGYLIMKTAGAQYAKGADFFYYEINGKRALPDKREMGYGAHALNNPDRRDTTKIEFEHKFNAFLNEYLSSKKG